MSSIPPNHRKGTAKSLLAICRKLGLPFRKTKPAKEAKT
jgi:hypothetical protein